MVAKRAGQFAGGFLNSPFGVGLLAIGAIGVTLFIFKDRISEFFGGLKFPEVTLPTINLPDITFPTFEFPEFPTIEFPEFPSFEFPSFEFPDFSNLFVSGGGELPDLPTSPEITAEIESQGGGPIGPCDIKQDAQGNVTIVCQDDAPMDMFSGVPSPPPLPPPPITVDPFLETEGEFVGGGPSFIGGSIGQTPLTGLFQVLDLFPGFSASQAANFLFQFSGILPSEALGLSQFEQFQGA